ncbi:Uma2 family endonuclease [Amycolatopsis tolypomycina]|uniref:Endonuclease, Uma2 family (Restriction endonuclease fold) n=1 Tax=Amycolatopsis tolypomycina TaxID=208445 RepID=A0A1H4JBC7_9PSEU|nr:Uma2 family endonuclease [Amycolatopsis tolypomycina]SEB42948.1 Endonuclease, Uma2 family (restriction endonuclease fold) [Amycolatopsis tolypomycina]
MSVMEWPHDLLSLDDWINLPETPEYQVEVVEGVLLVAPRPMPLHQRVVARLAFLIDELAADGYSALPEVEMVVSATPLTVRVPDVLVAPGSVVDANPPRIDAGDVRLVIEVLSEGTRRTDQVTKFSEYAEAGIEHYWIVDLDSPVSMITYRLIDGEYENFGEFSGVAEVEFAGSPLTIDLNALTTRRAQRP